MQLGTQFRTPAWDCKERELLSKPPKETWGSFLGHLCAGLLYLLILTSPGVLLSQITLKLPLPQPFLPVPLRYTYLCFQDPGTPEVPESQRLFAGFSVALTLATPKMLESLPGIGPALAETLAQKIPSLSPPLTWEKILALPGIGEKRKEILSQHFYLPGETPLRETRRVKCYGESYPIPLEEPPYGHR